MIFEDCRIQVEAIANFAKPSSALKISDQK